MAQTSKKQKVAIFDIDGTLFRSSLLVELVDELVKQKLIKESATTEYTRAYKKWHDRKGSYDDYIMAVVAVFNKHIKGVHYGDFMSAVKIVAALYRNRTYVYTRELAAKLKKKGYFLLAISGSPKAVLDIFCKPYGFDKVYGAIYEIGPSDRFTGEMVGEHILTNKANILQRALQKETITLKGSVGVGDTESDIAFLEMVDNPICFNPNKKLYKHAGRMKWEVVVERKDVIYFL